MKKEKPQSSKQASEQAIHTEQAVGPCSETIAG